jgi:thiol-disulfide isomerase/thioredoxin
VLFGLACIIFGELYNTLGYLQEHLMKRRAAVILVSSGWLSGMALAAMLAGCSSSDTPSPPTPRNVTTIPEVAVPVVAADGPRSEPTKSPTAESTPATDQPPPEKKKREPIYNEQADARADIHAALQRAAYDNKRVLVKFGGNWCGWCFKLHDLFRENKEIAAMIRGEYELVLVDVNTNRELLEEYDPNGKHGFPWLTVLDASGKVLCNQDTGSLEDGPKHDPQKVRDFLEKWRTAKLDAEQMLATAKDRARAENKRVLVHIGAPWCGWCHVLDRFLREQHDLIGVDYIDLKIDQDRMTGGKEVATRLRAGSTIGGIPWFVIVDADGKPLATSDGPRGNIGYPNEPHEIEYFVAMLHRTKQHLSDEQIATLERQLVDNAAKRKAAEH